MIRITVIGATGRMGRALVRLIAEAERMELAGAATEPGDRLIGQDAGDLAQIGPLGIAITEDLGEALAGSQVAIDFTTPAAADANIAACVDRRVALVMGTTGLSAEQQAALDEAGHHIAVVYGRNMSVGVNVLTELVARASRALGQEFDVEITEAHHRNKMDAPSGTALQLGEAVAKEQGTTLSRSATYDRHGVESVRKPGTIGFASIRAGSIVGEHTVMFASDHEIIEFRHRALDRQVFARGALRAAGWLNEKPNGLYSMNDVLGLTGQ
jgi:4-hydroxy-tetrahydrodipicolinate reductase